MASTTPTVRVLMLPGYTQNATLFHKKVAAIQRQCGPKVEFVFLDPPHILQPSDMVGLNTQELDSTAEAAARAPELLPRAWWTSNADRTAYYGLEFTIEYVRDFLAKQEQPITGVMGFSQGAVMAALLLALLERPHLYPPFLLSGKPPAPALKFGILISGFRPTDPTITHLFDTKIVTPTLHIIGQNDVIVKEERSRDLTEVCEGPRIELHTGSHFVPSKASWRHFFKAYINAFSLDSGIRASDVLSPSAGSAAVTPVATRPNTPPISA